MTELMISNDNTIIRDPDELVKKFVEKHFCYTDKSKQYQLKRMSKNVWSRNSSYYRKLQKEVEGTLYTIDEQSSNIVIPTGLLHLIQDNFPSYPILLDNRQETGAKISLPWIKKPHDLREYQEEAVSLMLSKNRGLINFATGLGKTLLALHFIQRYKRKTLIVCPSESVAKQFYEQFKAALGPNKVSFYGGGKKKISDVTVGIAASVTKNIKVFKEADLGCVINDECHHMPATTFYDITSGLASVGKIFGLTATDYRSDGKDIMITAGCGPIIACRDIKWGISNGWLAEPFFIVRKVETGGRDIKEDKLKNYKEHVLNNDIMKTQIREDAQKMMSAGKYVLILVDEVAHGDELSKELDIPFATGIDSQSQQYVDDLNNKKIQGLVGTSGKIGEGSDTKNVDVLIMANFIASKGPVIQAVGRGLRKQDDKTKCIILDYWPTGSSLLSRHALGRIRYYKDITDNVRIL